MGRKPTARLKKEDKAMTTTKTETKPQSGAAEDTAPEKPQEVAKPMELTKRELQMTARRQEILVDLQGTKLRNWDDICTAAQVLHSSNLAPKDFNSWQACAIGIEFGLELGMPWLMALQNIAVINGRPSLWGDALLALCRSKRELFDEEVFSESITATKATCTVRRKAPGRQPITREFTLEDAKAADLLGKDPWKKYPKRMLQMRARMWALRDEFPEVLKGMYSVEEIRDMGDPRTLEVQALRVIPEGQSKSQATADLLKERKAAKEEKGESPTESKVGPPETTQTGDRFALAKDAPKKAPQKAERQPGDEE
jgi:hypothetical protein